MLEVVIDTNVFISALTGGRTTSKIHTALRKGAFKIVLSDALLTELIDVLNRPEFGISNSDLADFIAFIRTYAKIITTDQIITICRDPEDNMILECAVSGKAKYIVTGDKDLLTLKIFQNIPILTPSIFIKLLESI
jgi:putative PIN family toxin of toxin-antitoxin system